MAPADHDVPRAGVLVTPLGTPAAPDRQALRAYLCQLLSDPRVVDLNPVLWKLLLRLIILPLRSARAAARYRAIWTSAGSPLLVHSRAQVNGLRERLGDGFMVVLGMRYGEPSLAYAMAQLNGAGIGRILVFPMFPQFSCSTTGSVYAAAFRAADGKRWTPALRYVPPHHDDPGYLQALCQTIRDHISASGTEPDRHLFSFHSLPQRYVDEGDPYLEHCRTTAHRLAQALGLHDHQWALSFHSRFGREQWLQPATDDLLRRWGKDRQGRVLVTCPGFTADCLETLDDIGVAARQVYIQAGGEALERVPCLNAHPAWLDAMAAMVRRETAGWME